MKRWGDFTDEEKARIIPQWIAAYTSTLRSIGAAVPSERWLNEQAEQTLKRAWFAEPDDLVINLT